MNPHEQDLNREITVTMPEKYWTVTLAALDELQRSSNEKIREMKEKHLDIREVDDMTALALTGAAFARGYIVKVMSEAGILTPEANERIGIDALLRQAEQYRKGQEDQS